MSIATDEAWNKFGDTESWMNRVTERNAYIAGRTAEPTEAEVEECAFAQFKAVNNSAWNLTEEQYRESWGSLPQATSDDFRRKARIGLEAARKAVTE